MKCWEHAGADSLYHDLAGWITMPLALAGLFIVYHLLMRLFIDTSDRDPVNVEPHDDVALHEQPLSRDSRPAHAFLLAAALGITVLSGLVHGSWTNRWETSQELELAVSRCERLPMLLGDWRGRESPADTCAIKAAGLDGCLSRQYENRKSGATVSLLLVCGRPGPVSVHTPDICYPGAGYEMVQERPVRFSGGSTAQRAEFLGADFVNDQSFPPDRLRVHWSWTATGNWGVPANPRIAFASHRYLYKMYLVTHVVGESPSFDDERVNEFLGVLIPALKDALFATGTQ